MVPLSERRHRIYESEMPEVVEGLKLHLLQLLKEKEEPEKAERALRVLFRLMSGGKGRIKYPDFSWDYLEHFIMFHRDELKLQIDR
jgi:hypothetical protein